MKYSTVICLLLVIANCCEAQSFEEWKESQDPLWTNGNYDQVALSFLDWHKRHEANALADNDKEYKPLTFTNYFPRVKEGSGSPYGRAKAYNSIILGLSTLEPKALSFEQISAGSRENYRSLHMLIDGRTALIKSFCFKIKSAIEDKAWKASDAELSEIRHDCMRALAIWSRLLVDHYDPHFVAKPRRSLGALTNGL